MEDLDALVVDPEDFGSDEPVTSRAPTKPLPRRGRLEIDLDDAKSVAEFLELMARMLKEKGRLIITIE